MTDPPADEDAGGGADEPPDAGTPDDAEVSDASDEGEGDADEGDAQGGSHDQARAPRRSRPWRRRVAWAVVAVVVGAIPLGARVAWEGRAELKLADAAEAQGRTDDAIIHLGRAARWRLPLWSHDEDALDRLATVAQAAEADQRTHVALSAHREIRRAILATRAWGVPHRDRFDAANAEIARLMAAQEEAFGTTVGGEDVDPEQYHLALLQRVPGPDSTWANLAAFAFVGWVIAAVGFVLRALDAHGRLRPRPALRWGGAAILLLAAWMSLLRIS